MSKRLEIAEQMAYKAGYEVAVEEGFKAFRVAVNVVKLSEERYAFKAMVEDDYEDDILIIKNVVIVKDKY